MTSAPSDKTAFVSFDGNRYSVHSDAAKRILTLVASDTEVRLLDGSRVVGQHAREWGKNLTIEAPEHRAAVLAHKPGAHDGKGRGRLRAEVPRIDELLRLWLEDGRYVGRQTPTENGKPRRGTAKRGGDGRTAAGTGEARRRWARRGGDGRGLTARRSIRLWCAERSAASKRLRTARGGTCSPASGSRSERAHGGLVGPLPPRAAVRELTAARSGRGTEELS